LHKETNQRKCSRSLGLLTADFPTLLEFAGSLKTRLRSDSSNSFSANPVLLGGVKWQKRKSHLIRKREHHG